jgi:hypothetical protein
MSAPRLSRRTVLRGLGGALIALPALEAFTARAGPTTQPRRFVTIYHPNGVFTPNWFPTAGASETDFTLGAIHAALQPWKAHGLWLSGVDLGVAVTGPGEQHQRGLGGLLTGASLLAGNFVGNDGSRAGFADGQSLDQALVGLIGQNTPIASLQLGVHCVERDVSGVLSYAGSNQPLLPENDPAKTFARLFSNMQGGTDGGVDELALVRARRASVLDTVAGQLGALQKKVSAADRQRLDAHLTRLRSLEQRLTNLPPGTCGAPTPPAADLQPEALEAIPEVARLQLEMVAIAFQCDLTRVATFCFSDAKNHISMPHLNINSDIHNLTHLSDATADRAQVGTRDAWQAGQIATFLSALESATQTDGSTLLDHSLLFWGSDVSRGNVHAHDNMPFFLAGHGAGFRMGRYLQVSPSRNHNDLLLAILQAFGGTATSFGYPAFCAGPLPGLS